LQVVQRPAGPGGRRRGRLGAQQQVGAVGARLDQHGGQLDVERGGVGDDDQVEVEGAPLAAAVDDGTGGGGLVPRLQEAVQAGDGDAGRRGAQVGGGAVGRGRHGGPHAAARGRGGDGEGGVGEVGGRPAQDADAGAPRGGERAGAVFGEPVAQFLGGGVVPQRRGGGRGALGCLGWGPPGAARHRR